MISDYIQDKLELASYKILKDRTYFGEIKNIKGIWSNAKTLEECREELREVLEDWIVVQIRQGNKIPGLPMNFDRRKDFSYA